MSHCGPTQARDERAHPAGAGRVGVRAAVLRGVHSVHGRAGADLARHELHRHARDRPAQPVGCQRGWPRQLREAVRRRAVPAGPAQHRDLRRRQRAAHDHRRAGRRARVEPGDHPAAHVLPGRLLPAGGHQHRRGRRGVAVPAAAGHRPRQQSTEDGRDHRAALAGRPAVRHAVDHRDDRVARYGLHDGGVPRRAAGHPAHPLRSRGDRRRRAVGPVPPRHAADAASHHAVRRRGHQHRAAAVHRGTVRDDQGRPAEQDPVGVDGRVQPVRLRQLRLRQRHELRAVPGDRGADRGLVPAAEVAMISGRRILYVVLSIGLIGFAGPFVWMLLSSFKPESELRRVPATWLPETVTLDNFRTIFTGLDFPTYFANSLIVATAVTLGNLALCSMLGYALAKIDFPGRRALFLLVIGTLMIPAMVTFVPQFVLVSQFGLVNTYPGLVLPLLALAGPLGVFLMRQYISELPDELIDSARIDGAGELQIFLRIIIPLSKPALATLTIVTFLGAWNNFLIPLVMAQTEDMYTMPVALALYSVGQNSTHFGLLMAGAVVVVLPVLLIFVALQRYFVQGIAMTGFK